MIGLFFFLNILFQFFFALTTISIMGLSFFFLPLVVSDVVTVFWREVRRSGLNSFLPIFFHFHI